MKEKDLVVIRLLTEFDALDFWELRLRALREEPSAFSVSYEEAVSRPIEEIADRFSKQWSGPEDYLLGSFKNGFLTGMVGFAREQRIKLEHKGSIWGMFVSAEVRGEGIGRLLLTEVISRARNLPGLEQIILTVTSGNEPAIKLYENLGFRSYGVERRALKVGFEYFDDILMVLPVKNE